MMRCAIILAALLLAGCGDDDKPSRPKPPVSSGWSAGPQIGNVDYSPGTTVSGNTITVPVAPGHTNYITRPCDLRGKSSMTLTYRYAGDATAHSDPSAPTMISLYFQAKDDNWSTDGKRWFGGTVSPIGTGGTIDLSLTGTWTSVQDMTSAANPAEFASAKAEANLCGFVLGGGTGLGHGVSGPATITIDSFTVQ